MDGEFCICGSGRPPGRCHGLRGRERRHRGRELQALGELHDLAYLFPAVRPGGEAFESFADRVAAEIGDVMREATASEATEGLLLLSVDEKRRVVRLWTDVYPARWHRFCRSIGDVPLAEVTLVTSAIRGAIADRHPCPRGMIAALEGGQFEGSTGAGIAFVIRPDAIWSYEEVLQGRREVTGEHLARLRTQVRRLEQQLPVRGLPRASARLARECRLLEDDDGLAWGVADLLFDAFQMQIGSHRSSIGSRN